MWQAYFIATFFAACKEFVCNGWSNTVLSIALKKAQFHRPDMMDVWLFF